MNPKNKFLDFLQPKNLSTSLGFSSSSPNMSVAPKTPVYPTPTGKSITPNMSVAPKTTTPTKAVTPTNKPVGNASATPPLSEAGKKFANALYDTATGARTAYGASQGVPDMLGGKPVAPVPINTPTSPTAPTPQQPIQPSSTDTAFAEYIKFLTPSAGVSTAKSAYNTAVADQSKAYSGFEGQGRGINTSLVRGQQEKYLRQTQPELARLQDEIDIAQAEQTGQRDVAKTRFEYEQGKEKPIEVGGVLYKKGEDGNYTAITGGKGTEGFTLGKDQSRYEINPTTGQYEQVAGNMVGVAGGGLSDSATFWADAISKGAAKLSDVPQDDRASVIQAMSGAPETNTPANQRAIDQANVALSQFDKIFSNPALNHGAIGRVLGQIIPGSNATDLQEALGTVQALIGFNELQKMRDASPTGGALGQVSEREIDFLQALAGSLKTKQGDEQLLFNIKEIQKSFQILKLVNSPSGTTLNVDGLNLTKQGENLLYQAPDGQTYRRLPDGSFSSFNSVGNTKASTGNLPQRNKNPGNIKIGGLADKLAIGKDNQGHLIFPDEATGFKAMQMDIEAKINGKSRYLPANPTLQQLGKVYAEDPNWPKSVAKILGISSNTNTKDIPINSLIKAIARQEGYYA